MLVAIWSLLFVFAFVLLFCLLLSQIQLGLYLLPIYVLMLLLLPMFPSVCYGFSSCLLFLGTALYLKLFEAWPIPSHSIMNCFVL